MERAGKAVVRQLKSLFKSSQLSGSPSVIVLCGPGNNGGDGFVVARLLKEEGVDVVVSFDTSYKEPLPSVAQKNFDRWTGEVMPLKVCNFERFNVIVDALFGIGLNRPIEDLYQDVIYEATCSELPCLAIDCPSGISADTGEVMGSALKADVTVTFGTKKRGHVLLPGRAYCGEIKIENIGFLGPKNLMTPLPEENLSPQWSATLPKAQQEQHKYSRGHVVVVGGAEMTGAPRLAAEASRRMGAGMVSIVCPTSAADIYKIACLGVLVKTYETLDDFYTHISSHNVHGLLIGPGLEPNEHTQELTDLCLKTKKPCAIDAGSISCFADNKEDLFSQLHDKCILLPHDAEFHRLFESGTDKIDTAWKAAKLAHAVVLLKGADTVIASPGEECYVNTNAPPRLATAGTGDVLAGMIIALMAQGKSPMESATVASWVHGEGANRGGYGFIAEDLLLKIPEAIAFFYEKQDALKKEAVGA